jgi:hypothetical protein
MHTLNLHGPFHLDSFGASIKTSLVSPLTKGVYVWGFAYNKNGLLHFDELTEFNAETMSFLPYYVGKSESSVIDRVRQHKNFRYTGPKKSIDAPKYIRMSENYMLHFFKDSDFPIFTSNKKNDLIKIVKKNHPLKTVTYHNHEEVLKTIYPGCKPVKSGTDHPITLQKYIDVKDDTLFQLAEIYHNFFFCFIPETTGELKLKYLEHYLFYCLKGKTVSQTNNNPKEGMTPKLFKLVDNTKTNILKKESNGNVTASNVFPGYF